MHAIGFLLAFAIGTALQGGDVNDAQRRAAEFREHAIRWNEAAAHIRSQGDSQKIVDELAEAMKDELPSAWATDAVRRRVAEAEFASVTDPSRLIPEERIVRVWNRYVSQIGAPDEAIITAAELHNLRDAQYASGRLLWEREGGQSIWTMPNIVAVGGDAKVANGCRALEAIRLLISMDILFENVRGARKRVRDGVLVSDQLANRARREQPAQAMLVATTDTNPIRATEGRYVREHGAEAMGALTGQLFRELFPEHGEKPRVG